MSRFIKKLRENDPKIGAAAEIALKTAARISDGKVLNLRVMDLAAGHVLIGDRKSRGKKRQIPIPGREIARAAIHGKKKGDKVFAYSRQYFCRKIRECRAGFSCRAKASCAPKDITTHSFRRTAITLMYQSGNNLHAIASISGHQSTECLARYIHTTTSQKLRALKVLSI
eukprot:g18158.t1